MKFESETRNAIMIPIDIDAANCEKGFGDLLRNAFWNWQRLNSQSNEFTIRNAVPQFQLHFELKRLSKGRWLRSAIAIAILLFQWAVNEPREMQRIGNKPICQNIPIWVED